MSKVEREIEVLRVRDAFFCSLVAPASDKSSQHRCSSIPI
jgi:hypothetical protein